MISLDAIIESFNFCESCSHNHPRVIPDECDDCVAGNLISFNYNGKEE